MTEWDIVIALGVLMALGAAIVKPILALTKAITVLNMTVEALKEDVGQIVSRNSESHSRIFDKLDNHEDRIIDLERPKRGEKQ